MKTEKQLLQLRKEIEEAKTEVSSLNGQLTAMMNQLKKDWGCNSLDEAEKKVNSMNKELAILQQKIEESIEEIANKYEVQKY